jgi:DNA repair exonuclease SbcCD nuclease subunit
MYTRFISVFYYFIIINVSGMAQLLELSNFGSLPSKAGGLSMIIIGHNLSGALEAKSKRDLSLQICDRKIRKICRRMKSLPVA